MIWPNLWLTANTVKAYPQATDFTLWSSTYATIKVLMTDLIPSATETAVGCILGKLSIYIT